MGLVETLALARALLQVMVVITDEDEWTKWQARIEAAGESLERVAETCDAMIDRIRTRREEIAALNQARMENPAFRKPGTLIALVAGLGLMMGAAGCASTGRVAQLPETETLRAGYGVTWPADASTEPEDYQTIMIDGRMRTTVPIGTGE